MRPAVHFVLYALGLASAETQTTLAERDCIAAYCSGRRLAAEIGVWHGVTSRRIAENLDSAGMLYGIDPYAKGKLGVSFPKLVAIRELRSVKKKVTLVQETGEWGAALLSRRHGRTFDFVFIDGNHTYDGLRRDWQAWSDLIIDEGVVALHDSRSTCERKLEEAGSVVFTREIILKDSRFELVAQTDTLSVLRRRRIDEPTSVETNAAAWKD